MALKAVIARMETFDWIMVVFFAACIVGGLTYAVFKASGG